MTCTRRDFLKKSMAGTLAAAVPAGSVLGLAPGEAQAMTEDSKVRWAFLVDTEKCVGCGNCTVYCTMGVIRIENGQAEVNEDECVECNTCHRCCESEDLNPTLVRILRKLFSIFNLRYDARMDEPQKRCISPGLVAAVTWSFPFEIVASDDKLVMLYEAFNLSRRVFTDGRKDPEFFPNSSLGYSTGQLENGELVVETRLLSQSTRDFNGEPISDNASTIEKYRLSDDGNRLSLVLILHDPENYERPPIRRRVWTRQDDAVIFPFECDPDSFFRQLFNEGRMQEYIDRTPRRP